MPNLEDDRSILDDEHLWRRVIPKQVHKEKKPGGIRPGSVAFRDEHEETSTLSLHRASLTTVARVYELVEYDDVSIAMITAGMARKLGYAVVPWPEENDPSHVVLYPSPNDADSRVLAKQAQWVACGLTSKSKWL